MVAALHRWDRESRMRQDAKVTIIGGFVCHREVERLWVEAKCKNGVAVAF